jgi:hypothetical protein
MPILSWLVACASTPLPTAPTPLGDLDPLQVAFDRADGPRAMVLLSAG